MTEPLWLGIDVGTQSVRVLAVDDDGQVAGAGAAPLTSRRDGPRHEQDPEQWWAAICAASGQALAGLDPERVAGLAVDATSGTILLTDASGHPVTPALMYDDARASEQAKRVDEVGQAVWSELGYQHMQPSWALPKLIWLLEHQSREVDHHTRLLHQADYVTWRLAGAQLPSDASHALKTGYHLIDERWPREVLAALDVPVYLMPRVVRPGSPIGSVSAAAERATSIPAGTPIVAGMTDGCAGQLGAGTLDVGAWNSVLGTTLVLKGVSDQLVRDPNGVLYCHRGPEGRWLPGGASSAGAGAIAARFPDADLDALTARAAALPIGPVAYPLVSGAERFPFRAADAAGFVIGQPDGDAGLFAALLLGTACIERLCFDYLDLLGAPTGGALSLTGGAARNRYWCQLRTDLLGRPVTLPRQPEAALGMALLAAASVTGSALRDRARRMVTVADVLEPDAARGRLLRDPYRRFVTALGERGWLPSAVVHHAIGRAEQ
jgi:D-ribulokinase